MEHHESVRNITVVKGGLSIMCPSVSLGVSISTSVWTGVLWNIKKRIAVAKVVL